MAWFTGLVPEVLTLAGTVVAAAWSSPLAWPRGRGAAAGGGGGAAVAAQPRGPAGVQGRRRRPASEATEVRRNVRVPQRSPASGRRQELSGRSRGPSGRRWPPWTWRRAGRRSPTCAAAGRRGRAGAVAGGDRGQPAADDPGDAAGAAGQTRRSLQNRPHPGAPHPAGPGPGSGARASRRAGSSRCSTMGPGRSTPRPPTPSRLGLPAPTGTPARPARGSAPRHRQGRSAPAPATWTSTRPPASGSASPAPPAPAVDPARPAQRFHDPDAGTIELDRVDLRRLGLARPANQWRGPQDPWTLDEIIADIWLRRPGASQADLEAAAALTGFNEILSRLLDGWSTQIGEGGARSSGAAAGGSRWPGRSCQASVRSAWQERPSAARGRL